MIVANLHFIGSQTGTSCRLHICFFFFFLSFNLQNQERIRPEDRSRVRRYKPSSEYLEKETVLWEAFAAWKVVLHVILTPGRAGLSFDTRWWKLNQWHHLMLSWNISRYKEWWLDILWNHKFMSQNTSCRPQRKVLVFTDCIKDWNLISFI